MVGHELILQVVAIGFSHIQQLLIFLVADGAVLRCPYGIYLTTLKHIGIGICGDGVFLVTIKLGTLGYLCKARQIGIIANQLPQSLGGNIAVITSLVVIVPCVGTSGESQDGCSQNEGSDVFV